MICKKQQQNVTKFYTKRIIWPEQPTLHGLNNLIKIMSHKLHPYIVRPAYLNQDQQYV